MDLIERQAAIDALRYAQHRFTVADEAGGFGTVKWSEDVIYFAAAERVLSELPSAQPEPQWIPCERELPAVGRSVLISVGGIYTAEGCLRDDGDWTQFRWDAIQRKDMVGAWKPLEKPYKGEQE